MTDASKMISELRAKISANRKQLEEQEHALAILEQMMAQPTYSSVFQPPEQADQAISLTLPLTTVPASVKPTQKEIIKNAIDNINALEFTVASISDVLDRTGTQFEGKNPRNRISVVIAGLEADGVIKKVFKGGGNVPHRYQKTLGH